MPSCYFMRRYFRLQRIMDTAEIILAMMLVLYVGCYTINYYFRDCSSSMHVLALLLFCAVVYYASTLLIMNLVVSKDKEYDKSHKFLSGFKNRKSAYEATMRVVKHTYVWKHFVRGANVLVIIKLLIAIKIMTGAVVMSTIGVAQGWGYLNVVLPVLLFCAITSALVAYRLTGDVLRSGSGYVKYLMHSHKALDLVDADFQRAEVISNDLRISYSTIYYRTPSFVFIIDRADIVDHALGVSTIALTSGMLQETTLLQFTSREEYTAVANVVLM